MPKTPNQPKRVPTGDYPVGFARPPSEHNFPKGKSGSLGSACVMDFTHATTGEKQSHLLEPKSLLVLSGDARYVWQHAIAGRKTDRYNGQIIQRTRRLSLTFRTINAGF